MPTTLVTIPAVPILRVGMGYPLSTGKKTFTEEDIAAAANAYATDPAVKAPRVKIDALAKAWNLDPEAHGGEPAFGWFDNLRVSENGQELLADAHVPEWVRDAMEWAYPSLSIEGTPSGWESPSGRTHEFVVTAVALLGTDWPGCTTLDDFRELLAKGPALADEPEEVVVARMQPVRASLDADLVGRRFYDALDGGDIDVPEGVAAYDLWIRSMRFDDNGSPYLKVTDEASGRLYRVALSVSGTEVTFGAMEEIAEQDVPVAAGARLPAPVASWNTREASRLAASTQRQEGLVPLDLAALRTRLGLPEDADEEAINTALAASPEPTPAPEPDPDPDPVASGDPEPEPDPAPAGVPEGMRLVDEAALAEIRQQAAEGAAVAARMRQQDRDTIIRAAISDGKFSPARREHFERLWERDPDGTRHVLTAKAEDGGLERGMVPVTGEVGASGDGEGAPQDEGTGLFHFDEAGA